MTEKARSWDLRDREGRLARLEAGVLILEELHTVAVEGEGGEGEVGRIERDVNEVVRRLGGDHDGKEREVFGFMIVSEEHKLVSFLDVLDWVGVLMEGTVCVAEKAGDKERTHAIEMTKTEALHLWTERPTKHA